LKHARTVVDHPESPLAVRGATRATHIPSRLHVVVVVIEQPGQNGPIQERKRLRPAVVSQSASSGGRYGGYIRVTYKKLLDCFVPTCLFSPKDCKKVDAIRLVLIRLLSNLYPVPLARGIPRFLLPSRGPLVPSPPSYITYSILVYSHTQTIAPIPALWR
jgi:hypothetical protein